MSITLNAQDKKTIRTALLCCAFFALSTYGYRMFSLGFVHDSLLIAQKEDTVYKIGIGRFLEPAYWWIRGGIAAPSVVALFLFAFLSLSVIVVLLTLRLRSTAAVVMVSGAMFSASAMLCEAAAFVNYADSCALALLLAVAGIALSARSMRMFPFGIVCVCLSLGLYQAYVQAGVVFALILLVDRLLEGENPRAVFFLGLRLLTTIVLGLMLYAACLLAVLKTTQIGLGHSYNGLASVGDYSGGASIAALVRAAYLAAFEHLTSAQSISRATTVACQGLLAAISALCVFKLCFRRICRSGALLLVLALLLIPFGMSFVLLISKGLLHRLMTYAYTLAYVLVAVIVERFAERPFHRAPQLARAARPAAAALTAVLLLQNISLANQLYLKGYLEDQATLSAMTRVLEDADGVEGYVPGETPVVIIGSLSDSAIAMERPGFSTVSSMFGMEFAYSTTYEATHIWYFAQSLGYPIALVSDAQRLEYVYAGFKDRLPAYPADGYCAMIDGKLFIRLS